MNSLTGSLSASSLDIWYSWDISAKISEDRRKLHCSSRQSSRMLVPIIVWVESCQNFHGHRRSRCGGLAVGCMHCLLSGYLCTPSIKIKGISRGCCCCCCGRGLPQLLCPIYILHGVHVQLRTATGMGGVSGDRVQNVITGPDNRTLALL